MDNIHRCNVSLSVFPNLNSHTFIYPFFTQPGVGGSLTEGSRVSVVTKLKEVLKKVTDKRKGDETNFSLHYCKEKLLSFLQ